MNEVFRHSVDQKLAMVEFLLPDYEKNCLFENDEKRKVEALLFTVEDFEIKEATLDFRKATEYPSVQHVAEEIKRERRELEGFEETIRVRHEY